LTVRNEGTLDPFEDLQKLERPGALGLDHLAEATPPRRKPPERLHPLKSADDLGRIRSPTFFRGEDAARFGEAPAMS
jgi:hypothetical protein